RRKVLDESIQERLHPLICTSEMMEDHVHLIIENNPKVPVTRTVGLLKGYTSKMLREEFPHL
ncbi:MAG: transposase, partial [Candidatus Poribacteria bacterium]|nr:transposase [Candidatus Poribacteria bacterium]